jgi:hypothetical protein
MVSSWLIIDVSIKFLGVIQMWIITKDYVEKGYAVGKCSTNYEKENHDKLIHKFRMLDDDNNVYYHGLSNNDSSFSPLDNFGQPNAGCSYIQYQNPITKVWETL